MNVNSASITPIKKWLQTATNQLAAASITSSNLDAELILAYVLKKPRTYIHAHPEYILTTTDTNQVNDLLAKRRQRVPLAYLTGHKEFYGRDFIVSPDVLIPRPESEQIINLLKTTKIERTNPIIYDIGTGSGCLGITAKLELPKSQVTLSDISPKSLLIARQNAAKLHANVRITTSNLLSSLPTPPDVIIANLPYVDKSWQRSIETNYEPAMALFASNGGLELIKKLLSQTSEYHKRILLFIEADPVQHELIKQYALKFKIAFLQQSDYILVLQTS